MARQALGKGLLRARVPPWVIAWWHSQALRHGFRFGDGPALGEFWEEIARGDYKIVCASQDNCATVISEGETEEVEPSPLARKTMEIKLQRLVFNPMDWNTEFHQSTDDTDYQFCRVHYGSDYVDLTMDGGYERHIPIGVAPPVFAIEKGRGPEIVKENAREISAAFLSMEEGEERVINVACQHQ